MLPHSALPADFDSRAGWSTDQLDAVGTSCRGPGLVIGRINKIIFRRTER